jgi:hypothetical protein
MGRAAAARWRVGWRWWAVALGTPLVVLALAAAANVAIWGAPAPTEPDMASGRRPAADAVR